MVTEFEKNTAVFPWFLILFVTCKLANGSFENMALNAAAVRVL